MFNKRLFGAIFILIVLSMLLSRCRAGSSLVSTVNSEGYSVQQLTMDRTGSFHPTWSPDGSRFAFHRRIDGWKHIFTMKTSGGDALQLTTGENANFDPNWSVRDQIAFVCHRNTVEQICIMNSDGSDLRQLTYADHNSNQPSWSPNGDRLVFWHACSLYVMDAAGSNPVSLLSGSEFNCASFPDWSPDGQQIAFRFGSASGGSIYVMNLDGSNVRQLTDDSGNNRKPTWSPNGRRIAFEHDEQLFVMNADGSGLTALSSRTEASSRYPEWSPRGDAILYERLYGSDVKYGDRLFQIQLLAIPKS